MFKKLKYISLVVAVLSIIVFTVFYLQTVDRDSLYSDKHFITIFTEEVGWGPNSHYESYIVPRFKISLSFMEHYDYIKMIDAESKLIAIKNDKLKIYIRPNKVIVHQDDKSYEVEENTITHLKDFSGFKDVTLYHGKSFDSWESSYEKDKIKEQFVIDTEQYRIQEDF